MRNILLVGLIALALGLVACDDDDTSDDAIAPTATSDATVEITDITVGDGAEVAAGDIITLHYTGLLEDGTQFESSVGGDPVRFPLDRLIPGWQDGIPGMKVGRKRTLIIPPALAYGEGGSPPNIPPNATLTFEIELLGTEPPPTPTPAP